MSVRSRLLVIAWFHRSTGFIVKWPCNTTIYGWMGSVTTRLTNQSCGIRILAPEGNAITVYKVHQQVSRLFLDPRGKMYSSKLLHCMSKFSLSPFYSQTPDQQNIVYVYDGPSCRMRATRLLPPTYFQTTGNAIVIYQVNREGRENGLTLKVDSC